MILSRTKSDSATSNNRKSIESGKFNSNKRNTIPSFEEFIMKRDYTGAQTILEFSNFNEKSDVICLKDQWKGFCYFHLGNYQNALECYENIKKKMFGDPKDVTLNIAVCMFYLGML